MFVMSRIIAVLLHQAVYVWNSQWGSLCLLLTLVSFSALTLLAYLGVRKSIRPVKIEWWGAGVVICLERGVDCFHMVQLMPLPSQKCIIFHLNPDILLSGTGLPRWSWKGHHTDVWLSYRQLSELLARLDDWRYGDVELRLSLACVSCALAGCCRLYCTACRRLFAISCLLFLVVIDISHTDQLSWTRRQATCMSVYIGAALAVE